MDPAVGILDLHTFRFLCFLFFLKYASPELEEEGRKRYEAQKMERLETKARIEEVVAPPSNPGDAASC